MSRLFTHHSRFLFSAAAASVLYFLLPADWAVITGLLVSWNVGVLMYVTLVLWWSRGLSAQEICDHYKDEDQAAPVILIVSIIAAILAMASIVAFLGMTHQLSETERSLQIALAPLTVISSWLLIPTLFTLHYADMFYSTAPDARPLRFPETPMPAFWDFAYFSFTIAVACQTADVSTSPGSIRKVLIVHSVLSFFFNVAILGFAINVTAGLSGNH